MKPLAILAAALVALYMLGRSRGRTLGPAPAPEPDVYVPMATWLPEPDAWTLSTDSLFGGSTTITHAPMWSWTETREV